MPFHSPTLGDLRRAQMELDRVRKATIRRGRVDSRTLADKTFRRIMDWEEIHSCGRQSSYDIQSGPIMCDEPAKWILELGDGRVGTLCDRCARLLDVKRSSS